MRQTQQSGFTLLEMAVVMVGIGLMIGAVMLGQNMVRNGHVRGIGLSVQSFKQAVGSFQTKYGYLPGDFPTAESVWGADAACPNTPSNTVKKTATCNGNGNGTLVEQYEQFRAWQHLSNAGLLKDGYTGVAGAGSVIEALPGTNVPAGTIAGTGFAITYIPYSLVTGAGAWVPFFFDVHYEHAFVYGMAVATAEPRGAALNPDEAKDVDNKFDDGRPGTGDIVAYKSVFSPGCTTTDVEATSEYVVTTKQLLCSLIFVTGF